MLNDSFLRSPLLAPPTAFYYSVRFDRKESMDSSFQEVSGLKLTFGIEEKKEGGDNRHVHYLPTPPKYDNLVLKRCLTYNSKLERWCKNAFENFNFDPKDFQIILLGYDKIARASWNVVQAYPIGWELSPLNSTSNQLAIETLTLKYRYFKREL